MINFLDFVTRFFDQSFGSRWNGTCGGWTKELVVAHVVADLLIWLAYMTIPILLIKLARVKKDLPFNMLFLLFAMFIIGCGLTHLMGAITAFFPYYYLDFWIKLITALASIGTAWMLWRTYPQMAELPNPFTALAIIEKTNKELENANKELENFALVAAHDLQDPLKQNQVFAKFIENGKLEFIPKMMYNNQRMQNFIKNLLTFARSGGTHLKIETASIKTVLDGVIIDLETIISESNANIIIGDMPSLKCDPVQIGRVFQNLIKNAIKCRSEQPLEIKITASKKDFWTFSIEDNGVGIPASAIPTLFAVYLGKKNDQTGSGFGLAICKRIVESHGGSIRVKSEEDKGTLFVFTIGTMQFS